MRLLVLAILLIFLEHTLSAFIDNIEDCTYAHLNDVCTPELAADPNICACRLCSEVCDPDGRRSSDCDLQRRFGRCWNVAKRNLKEKLLQNVYVNQEEKGANAGNSKSNDNIEGKQQIKVEAKHSDSSNNGLNSKQAEKTQSDSMSQSEVQVRIEKNKSTSYNSDKSRNFGIFGIISIIVGVVVFMFLILIIGLNIWIRRKANHRDQLQPVLLQLETFNDMRKPNEPEISVSSLSTASYVKNTQNPGEVAGEVNKPLLEVGFSGSKNLKPDELQLHSHASGTEVHVESSIDPQNLPHRDRLHTEMLSKAKCFEAPDVQPIQSIFGPPPVLNPGTGPPLPDALEQVAEGHLVVPPVDQPPPHLPPIPVQAVPPRQPDAPSEAADLEAVAEATPSEQQPDTSDPIIAQAQQTTSDGTTVEEANNSTAISDGEALIQTAHALSHNPLELPYHNAQADENQDNLISPFTRNSCK